MSAARTLQDGRAGGRFDRGGNQQHGNVCQLVEPVQNEIVSKKKIMKLGTDKCKRGQFVQDLGGLRFETGFERSVTSLTEEKRPISIFSWCGSGCICKAAG